MVQLIHKIKKVINSEIHEEFKADLTMELCTINLINYNIKKFSMINRKKIGI